VEFNLLFLKSQQAEMKDQVTKFDKFLKENEVKRTRALKRADEERKVFATKDEESKALFQELAKLKLQCDAIKKLVEKEQRYEKYLEEVVRSGKSDDFADVPDLLGRYETLRDTHNDLRKNQVRTGEEIEELRNLIASNVKDKQNEILVSNSETANCQKKLEALRSETLSLEQDMAARDNVAKLRIRTLGEIKLAILNIHQRCQFKTRFDDRDPPLNLLLANIEVKLTTLNEIVKHQTQ